MGGLAFQAWLVSASSGQASGTVEGPFRIIVMRKTDNALLTKFHADGRSWERHDIAHDLITYCGHVLAYMIIRLSCENDCPNEALAVISIFDIAEMHLMVKIHHNMDFSQAHMTLEFVYNQQEGPYGAAFMISEGNKRVLRLYALECLP